MKTKIIKSTLITFFLITIVVKSLIAGINSHVVTTTSNSGVGSLRQAIINANSITSTDSIIFNIPLSDPGYDPIRGVFRIKVSGSLLNDINRNGLVIDGFSQTRFTGNTNIAILGTGNTVGVDNISFPFFEGPEIEIVDDGGLIYCFRIMASKVKVIGLAITGFGNSYSTNHGNIVVQGSNKFVVIERNILGCYADSFSKPDSAYLTGGCNIYLNGSDSGFVNQNILSWAGVAGIYATADADAWTVTFNETSSNGFGQPILDGMDFATASGYQKILYNKLYNNAANGLDTYLSKGFNLIENNTIYGNGVINWENSGIRVYGEGDIIKKNVIHSNRGAGILITSAATNHVISQNSIWGNGAFASNGIAATKNIGINLITSIENHSRGTAPFYSLNDWDDIDIGGNDIINYPIIENVKISPTQIEIEGYSLPNSLIEFFIGDTLSLKNYPQGRTFLFSAIEGSSQDLNSNSGPYGAMPINGINQGSDYTNMFKFVFPLPSNVSLGTILTATATLNNKTSEFSPAGFVKAADTTLTPILDCIYANGDSSFTAIFGYQNNYTNNVYFPIGNNNQFLNGIQNLGQPITFLPGLNQNVFSVQFNNNLTWKLTTNTITATTSSNLCPADLSVDKKLIYPLLSATDTIFKNDTIIFAITVKNNSIFPSAYIQILDTIPQSFSYISSNSSLGSYQPINGFWSINFLPAYDTAILYIVAKVDTSGQNDVYIVSQSQPDPNFFNNYSFASVTMSNSSSGNDGGIESNGNMASKIAYRKYIKHKEATFKFNNSNNLEAFTKEKVNDGTIKTSKLKSSLSTDLLDFIPQIGPLNTIPFLSTPTDLLDISNAIEVFAVDYFSSATNRKAAILAMTTPAGSVYEHTKMVCDRLDGAKLEDIKYIYIKGKPFIIAKLVQDNGNVDYSISFIAYKNSNIYTVDNQWDIDSYSPNGNNPVLNFQVWSTSENYTVDLITKILELIPSKGYLLNYINNYPSVIPTVYVKSGTYKNGNLILEVVNKAQANSLILKGTLAKVENGIRSNLNIELPINQSLISEVIVPIGYVFDVGFTIINDAQGGKDVLYYADGPWGLDYEQSGANVSDFSITAQLTNLPQNAYNLERNAYVEGSVKDYISLFKILKVGNKEVNISNYNTVEFVASGTGTFDIVITKKSTTNWNQQYKTSVNLTSSLVTYKIPFSQFKNHLGQNNFSPNDVIAIVFVKKGNGATYSNFSIKLKNLRFTQNPVNIEEYEHISNVNPKINTYPNPFRNKAKLNYSLPKPSKVEISIYNVDGQKVKSIAEEYIMSGNHTLEISSEGLCNGVYFIYLKTEESILFEKIVVL